MKLLIGLLAVSLYAQAPIPGALNGTGGGGGGGSLPTTSEPISAPSGTGTPYSYVQSAAGLPGMTQTAVNQQFPTAQNFHADPTGVVDSTPAFQSALNWSHANHNICVLTPPGSYKLSTPIMVNESSDAGCFKGNTTGRGTVLLPVTAAFLAIPTPTFSGGGGFSLSNINIEGGTNPIDLGTENDLLLDHIYLLNYSGVGISVLESERNHISNIQFSHTNTSSGFAGFSFTDPRKSLNAAYYATNGITYGFVARGNIEHIHDQGDPSVITTRDQYLIWADPQVVGLNDSVQAIITDSNCSFSCTQGIMRFHNSQVDIKRVVTDNAGGAGTTPAFAGLYFTGLSDNPIIKDFYNYNTGSQNFRTAVRFEGPFHNLHMEGNYLNQGDNLTTFGVEVLPTSPGAGCSPGLSGEIVGLYGSYWNGCANSAYANQVTIVGGNVTSSEAQSGGVSANNTGNSINFADQTNTNAGFSLLHDYNNGALDTGIFFVNRGKGTGFSVSDIATDFALTSTEADILRPLVLDASLQSLTGQVRLPRADSIGWRNNANSGDLLLGVNTSNLLTFNGTPLLSALSLDQVGNPVTTKTFAMGSNFLTFTFGATTGAAANMFTVQDTASNTGTGYVATIGTAASSAAGSLQVLVKGVAALSVFSNGGTPQVNLNGLSVVNNTLYSGGGAITINPNGGGNTSLLVGAGGSAASVKIQGKTSQTGNLIDAVEPGGVTVASVGLGGQFIGNMFTGKGTATFSPQTGAGTGATAVCATSHVCDSFSGEVTLTTGSVGTPATGSQLIVTLGGVTRTNQPNCAVTVEGGTTFLGVTHSASTTALTVSAGVALVFATPYEVTYVCGGQ